MVLTKKGCSTANFYIVVNDEAIEESMSVSNGKESDEYDIK